MKLSTIGLALSLVATLTFSPALGSLAQAGSINYEGISSLTVDDGYEMHQHRGRMINFSFGGPKDYRQKKSVQDMQKAKMDSDKLEAYGVMVIAIGLGILTWTQ